MSTHCISMCIPQAEESYETPIVCGGVQSYGGRGNIATNKCFALYNNLINADNSTADQYLPLKNITGWKETTPMLEARAQAAAVKILEAGMTAEYNWWFTGGLDEDESPLKSSEIRWLNGSWTVGPRLPKSVYVNIYGKCLFHNIVSIAIAILLLNFFQMLLRTFLHSCSIVSQNVQPNLLYLNQ